MLEIECKRFFTIKNIIISISIDNEMARVIFIACNKRILYNISSFSLNDLNLDIILEF